MLGSPKHIPAYPTQASDQNGHQHLWVGPLASTMQALASKSPISAYVKSLVS